MPRSFTDQLSNKLFVSRLETQQVLEFVRSRRTFKNPGELPQVEMLNPPDPGLVADFIHEICHFWCFDSFVGHAISIVDLRQRLAQAISAEMTQLVQRDVPPSPSQLEKDDVGRLLTTSALLTPIAEGVALFTEFDVWRSEHYGKLRTPISVLDLLFSYKGISEEHRSLLIDQMLERQRDTSAFIRRKANLYLSEFEIAQGYLPGYTAIKSLTFELTRAFPEVKQEAVLQFLKDYFWNDPVLARLILVGEEAEEASGEPISREEIFITDACLHGWNRLDARREYFRRTHRSKPFDPKPIFERLVQRVNQLTQDRSLGGKLGAIQARLEHGTSGHPTWEIDVNTAEIERFEAVETELRSYAATFLMNHPLGDRFILTKLAAPFILGLSGFRRVSPLMTVHLRIEEKRPKSRVACKPRTHGPTFEVAKALFPELSPGEYTYFLICNARTLAVSEVILDSDQKTVVGAEGDVFTRDPEWGVNDFELYRGLLDVHAYIGNLGETSFYPALSDAEGSSKFRTMAEDLAMELYLNIATMFVEPVSARTEVKRRLRAEGLKAFLPKKSKLINLAAKLSLYSNAASNLEMYWMYMSVNAGNREEEIGTFEEFSESVVEIFNSDPHMVVFKRVNNDVVWAT